jgi:hypothetical protein
LLLIDVWQRRTEVAAIAVAATGVWLFWSIYSNVSRVSWFYDRVEHVRNINDSSLPAADYELNTLPWQTASPRVFDLKPSLLTLVTNREPYAYQVFATVETRRAGSADIQFDAEVQSGGVTIGLLQDGKWIATNSAQRPGRFADANTAELGRSRSLTLVIANDNPAGESRLVVRSLKLYLRR